MIFLRAGLAFGGGLGILAVLEDELVTKRQALTGKISSPTTPSAAPCRARRCLPWPGATCRGAFQQGDCRGLYISVNTVKSHVASLFNKLGVDTRAQLVALVAERGLL